MLFIFIFCWGGAIYIYLYHSCWQSESIFGVIDHFYSWGVSVVARSRSRSSALWSTWRRWAHHNYINPFQIAFGRPFADLRWVSYCCSPGEGGLRVQCSTVGCQVHLLLDHWTGHNVAITVTNYRVREAIINNKIRLYENLSQNGDGPPYSTNNPWKHFRFISVIVTAKSKSDKTFDITECQESLLIPKMDFIIKAHFRGLPFFINMQNWVSYKNM